VTKTNIPDHLLQMLHILVMEETEMIEEYGSASDQTGPCMEHLLHENILETLTTFGRGDTPPGMKQQVLSFATKLLGKIKQPLLPHVNVHKPIIKLGKSKVKRVSNSIQLPIGIHQLELTSNDQR